MTKQELRKLIRERKALCTMEERTKLSEEICRKVMATPAWQDARTVLLYHALPDEVNTLSILRARGKSLAQDKAITQGKTLLLPVVVGDDLELHIFDGSTAEGAFHIQEPTGQLFTDYPSIDLAIIPGMAFDREGHRLGRGKGYYDRLLPRLTHAYRLGICFPFQLLDSVPTEEHDIKMDAVISTQS